MKGINVHHNGTGPMAFSTPKVTLQPGSNGIALSDWEKLKKIRHVRTKVQLGKLVEGDEYTMPSPVTETKSSKKEKNTKETSGSAST